MLVRGVNGYGILPGLSGHRTGLVGKMRRKKSPIDYIDFYWSMMINANCGRRVLAAILVKSGATVTLSRRTSMCSLATYRSS